MIDVSTTDFLKLYGGMVRVLKEIEKAGPGQGLPSRKLAEDVLHSRSHGWIILNQAEQMGYIKRKKMLKQKGQGGHYYILNYLTPRGHKLLKELEEGDDDINVK
jgi:hypothetical protein